MLTLDELRELQRATVAVYVDPAPDQLRGRARDRDADARRATASSSWSDYIAFGASPRGPIAVVQAARALALAARPRLRASSRTCTRSRATRFRHRLVLTYQALAEEADAERILDAVLAAVPVPQVDLARTSAA